MAYSRRLPFFNKKVIDPSKISVLNTIESKCSTCGHGYLWLGDVGGTMYRIDRAFHITSFQAHEGQVLLAHQMKQHDLLITIGDNQSGEKRLKIWNLAKWQNKRAPFCCRDTSTTVAGGPSSPITCIAVDESLRWMVLGHENGIVQLLKGDIMRERQCKRQILYEFLWPVTGLGLFVPEKIGRTRKDEHQQQTEFPGPLIFAASEQSIMSFLLGDREEIKSKTVLDRFGVPLNCTAMILTDEISGSKPQFAVACRDAIYFYNWDGRGPCLATDGEKIALTLFKNYLVVLKKKASGSPSSETMITIHDYCNKFIAGEFQVIHPCSVFIEWNGIYLLHQNGNNNVNEDANSSVNNLICLVEEDTQSKLDMLFSKKNFNLAIEIARSQHFSDDELARIFWHYADYLYKQKDYDGAIAEYCKTIGKLEASLVIQRFLEGSHIVQLTRYLEALQETNLATGDHLILLLNCYCRLQDRTKIEQFVTNPVNPSLDVDSALQILRQSNYTSEALKLADKAGRSADHVGLLIEDLNDGALALRTIEELPFDQALKAVYDHGCQLMNLLPVETIHFLEKLCRHPNAVSINVHYFIKIFINKPEGLMQFLDRYITNISPSKLVPGVVDTLLELILYEANPQPPDSQTSNPAGDSQLASKIPTYQKKKLLDMAMKLLGNDELPYDQQKALVLCHQRQFYDGCLYLWEKQKRYEQMLRHHMAMNNPSEALLVCHKYGDQLPSLWLVALPYFARRSDCADSLKQVIENIEHHNLASPLTVLELLTRSDQNGVCTIGTVRDYMLRHLEVGCKQINLLRSEVNRLRKETNRSRELVRKLRSQVKVFQQQKCALCHQSLEPPSIHFLCDHSYHEVCFENYANSDRHCPECAPRNKKLLTDLNNIRIHGSTAYSTTPTSTDQLTNELRRALQMAHHPTDSPPPTNCSTNSSLLQLNTVLAQTLSKNPFDLSTESGSGPKRSDAPLYLSITHQMGSSKSKFDDDSITRRSDKPLESMDDHASSVGYASALTADLISGSNNPFDVQIPDRPVYINPFEQPIESSLGNPVGTANTSGSGFQSADQSSTGYISTSNSKNPFDYQDDPKTQTNPFDEPIGTEATPENIESNTGTQQIPMSTDSGVSQNPSVSLNPFDWD